MFLYQKHIKIYKKHILLFHLILHSIQSEIDDDIYQKKFPKDKDFSDTENRMLAQKPKFTLEKFMEGRFTKKFEKYKKSHLCYIFGNCIQIFLQKVFFTYICRPLG